MASKTTIVASRDAALGAVGMSTIGIDRAKAGRWMGLEQQCAPTAPFAVVNYQRPQHVQSTLTMNGTPISARPSALQRRH